RNDADYWKDVQVAEHVQEQLQSVELTIFRIERLLASVAGLREALQRAQGRGALESIARRLTQFSKHLLDARGELCVMRWEGSHDALVHIAPVGATGRDARDRMAQMYEAWATHRQWVVDCLHEPRTDDEPVLIAIKGTYAYGMTRLEAGMHRFR